MRTTVGLDTIPLVSGCSISCNASSEGCPLSPERKERAEDERASPASARVGTSSWQPAISTERDRRLARARTAAMRALMCSRLACMRASTRRRARSTNVDSCTKLVSSLDVSSSSSKTPSDLHPREVAIAMASSLRTSAASIIFSPKLFLMASKSISRGDNICASISWLPFWA